MPAAEEKSLSSISKVGILAGGGALPRALALACQKQGITPFMVGFAGQTDRAQIEGFPHFWTHLGAAGAVMKTLKKQGISDIVMIGGMRRPTILELRPDFKTAEFFAKLGLKALGGDDGFLKALKGFLQKEGFAVHGAHRFMPQLLTPEGVLGRIQPQRADLHDVARGVEVLKVMGALDIGQAVVVQGGMVLGVEAAEGTDALLKRCEGLKRAGRGGVLVKLCKPDQDRDLDLPTIGPRTIENAKACGLVGVAVHAGASLIAQCEEVIRLADSAGLFVMGVEV